MAKIKWLLFTAQLPATPSSLRVNVWRRLRNAGAASLQNGIWILPQNRENTVFIERLLGYIKENQATGQIFIVQELNQAIQEDILVRFKEDREQEYEEFLEQCELFTSEIKRETQAGKFTFAELEETEHNLHRLSKWIEKIQKRDFFETTKTKEAITALETCREKLQTYTHQVYAQEGIEIPPGTDTSLED